MANGKAARQSPLWSGTHVDSGAKLYITERKDRAPLLVLMENTHNILTATIGHFGVFYAT